MWLFLNMDFTTHEVSAFAGNRLSPDLSFFATVGTVLKCERICMQTFTKPKGLVIVIFNIQTGECVCAFYLTSAHGTKPAVSRHLAAAAGGYNTGNFLYRSRTTVLCA